MATVIDALVISLNLDPKGFTKGQKEAVESLKKTEAQAVKTAKEMEAKGKQSSQFFDKVRNSVLALGAAFVGLHAIRSFVENITTSDAALGRMAKNVGMSTSELSAWQGAADKTGGSAEGMAGSIKGMVSQYQEWMLTGSSESMQWMGKLGISVADAAGKMRPMNDLLLDLADRFKGMNAAQAQKIGANIGLDEGTINLLMKGRKEVEGLLQKQMQMNAVTQRDADAAARRELAWKNLMNTFNGIGRVLLNELSPIVMKLLGQFGQWITKAENINAIKEAIRELGKFISSINWNSIVDGIKLMSNIAKVAINIVKILGDSLGGIVATFSALASGDIKGALSVVKEMFVTVEKKPEEYGKPATTSIKPSAGLAVSAGARMPAGNTTKTSSSNTDVRIGQITVQTQSKDAKGIASSIGSAFNDNVNFALNANTGFQ